MQAPYRFPLRLWAREGVLPPPTAVVLRRIGDVATGPWGKGGMAPTKEGLMGGDGMDTNDTASLEVGDAPGRVSDDMDPTCPGSHRVTCSPTDGQKKNTRQGSWEGSASSAGGVVQCTRPLPPPPRHTHTHIQAYAATAGPVNTYRRPREHVP